MALQGYVDPSEWHIRALNLHITTDTHLSDFPNPNGPNDAPIIIVSPWPDRDSSTRISY